MYLLRLVRGDDRRGAGTRRGLGFFVAGGKLRLLVGPRRGRGRRRRLRRVRGAAHSLGLLRLGEGDRLLYGGGFRLGGGLEAGIRETFDAFPALAVAMTMPRRVVLARAVVRGIGIGRGPRGASPEERGDARPARRGGVLARLDGFGLGRARGRRGLLPEDLRQDRGARRGFGRGVGSRRGRATRLVLERGGRRGGARARFILPIGVLHPRLRPGLGRGQIRRPRVVVRAGGHRPGDRLTCHRQICGRGHRLADPLRRGRGRRLRRFRQHRRAAPRRWMMRRAPRPTVSRAPSAAPRVCGLHLPQV